MKPLLAVFVLLLCTAMPAAAQTVAFKTGERTRGNVKDCFYSALGHDYVYTVGPFELCPLSVPVSTAPASLPAPTGGTAFKSGEVLRDNVKDCYYTYLGQQYLYTISALALCPLSVQVP